MKKFDKKIIEELKTRIQMEMKKPAKKRCAMRLSLKENNVIKEIDPNYSHDLLGAYNGYGYTRLGKHLMPENFSIVSRRLKTMETVEKKEKNAAANSIDKWIRRLVRLSGITEDEARRIAEEKEEYKAEKIAEMIERDSDSPSIARGKLISKMERENPLRYIRDADHATAIISASKRHKESNYENKLEEGRELAAMGEIEKSEVKEYARKNYNLNLNL